MNKQIETARESQNCFLSAFELRGIGPKLTFLSVNKTSALGTIALHFTR